MMPNGKRKVFLHPISSDGNNLAQEDCFSVCSGVSWQNVSNSDAVKSWMRLRTKKALRKKAKRKKVPQELKCKIFERNDRTLRNTCFHSKEDISRSFHFRVHC